MKYLFTTLTTLKSILLVILAVRLSAGPMAANADPITITFIQDFGVDGFLDGSFTGEDINLDGDIEFFDDGTGADIVTAYSIIFTPGSANSGDITPFTLGLPLLDRLFFTIGGTVVVAVGGEDGGLEHFYNCNDATQCFVGDIDNIYGGGANMVTSATAVTIDIKPGGDPNSINPASMQKISVAILTTGDFDALLVDPLTVQFGPDGATESHGRWHVEDVDGDGDMDLLFHFNTQETGIVCGDTEATLTGETFDGQEITGTDSINTVSCN